MIAEALMRVVEVSENPKVARLAQLTQDLQQSCNVDQTLRALQTGFADGVEILTSMLLSTRGLAPGEYHVVRVQVGGARHSQIDLEVRDRIAGRSGGVIGSIISCERPRLIEDVDWSDDRDFADVLRGHASIIAIPFKSNHLPMNWVLLLRKAPRRFTMLDVENAMERVALGTALLENQVLAADLSRANERIDKEARDVGALQRALLPSSLPQIAGLEIAASYEPSGRAGGDLYDFFELDRGRWCIFIGDASGHGLAAAIVMAIVQAVLHAHPEGVDGPAMLMTHANRQLCAKRIGGFFTAFLGIYDSGSHRLAYVNAGHPPPLLKRAVNGSIEPLDAVLSYPLGIDDSESFEESNIELRAGDAVVLYTDGITEARCPTREMFGRVGLIRAIRDDCGGGRNDFNRVIASVRSAVRAHQQDEPVTDDQTLVAVRVL